MKDTTIVLQAGGRSTRMGADKATVPFMGTTLMGYVLEQARALSDDILLVSNDHARHGRFGLPMFVDLVPDWGALGGVYTAVHAVTRPWCLLLACDMPFLSLDLVHRMAGLREEADAVIPRVSARGFTEPFRAFYHKDCLGPIESAVQAGKRRVDSFFGEIRVRYFEREEAAAVDPGLRSFFNVNTPEDLAEAVRLAESSS